MGGYFCQEIAAGDLNLQALGNRRQQELGRLHRGQGNKTDAAGESAQVEFASLDRAAQRSLHRTPSGPPASASRVLPIPPTPSKVKRRQSGFASRLSICASSALTADQGCGLQRKIVRFCGMGAGCLIVVGGRRAEIGCSAGADPRIAGARPFGANLLKQRSGRVIRWHAQFGSEQMAAGFVLGEGGAALIGLRQQAHELAVGGFMQRVELEQALGDGDGAGHLTRRRASGC